MPIPPSQLATWSHQGAIKSSSAAYASIKHALEKASSPLANRGVDIFLQGSYANSTNIYGDSDVDVVVLYPNTWYRDLSPLTPPERQAYEAAVVPATYTWSHLRDETLAALRSHYGIGAVAQGKKSIKVQTGSGRLPSDVVPAVAFRRYATFIDHQRCTAYSGIEFLDSSNNPIVNYPKYHIERGESKNQASRTGGQYKATVRIFKNFRNYLVDHGLLAKAVAPSYFIECTLYNVPDPLFVGAFTDTVPAILTHLLTKPHTGFLCQNGVVGLIGSGSTQWSEANFAAFVAAAVNGWNNWS